MKFSACELFTKHRERIQKFRETGNLKHLNKNELNKACFALLAAYSDRKDLSKRTISDKFKRRTLTKLLKILRMMNIKEL